MEKQHLYILQCRGNDLTLSPVWFPSGLKDVYLGEGLWGAAVLHPEEAVPAEWPPVWRPPLPRHWRLALSPGQQDWTCGLEEASGELVWGVQSVAWGAICGPFEQFFVAQLTVVQEWYEFDIPVATFVSIKILMTNLQQSIRTTGIFF